MHNRVRNILVAAAAMLAAGSVQAADGLQDKLDKLSISGFVDASYSGDNVSKTRGFGLDQVELDIEYSEDNVGLRFDLQTTPSAAGPMSGDQLTEQGYMYVRLPGVGDDGATFTFGKFNAPIGWELLDAPDMYQFSHAMVFNNGLPTNIAGASLAASFGMIDGILYVGNYVDVNNVTAHGAQSFGTRIGFTPADGINIGLSYLHTTNPGTTADRTLDVDFTYDAMEGLVIGAEYNQTQKPASKSGGYFATVHYDFSSFMGATLRWGTFDFDKNTAGKATQTTIALTSSLGGGLGALVEYRSLSNTMPVGIDGAAANGTLKGYAFEMTYAF